MVCAIQWQFNGNSAVAREITLLHIHAWCLPFVLQRTLNRHMVCIALTTQIQAHQAAATECMQRVSMQYVCGAQEN